MIRRVFSAETKLILMILCVFLWHRIGPTGTPKDAEQMPNPTPRRHRYKGSGCRTRLNNCVFYTLDVFAHRTFGNSSKSDGTMCVFVFRDVLCGSLAANPRSTEKRWAIIRDYWKCVQKLTKQPVKDQGLQFNKRGGR